MAVVNKWVNSSVEADKKGNPANVMPGQVFSFASTFEVAAADSDTSIYKVARLKSNFIPIDIKINADSSLGTSSISLGLYKTNGDVQDVDCFTTAADYTAGAAMGSEINGLSALPIADIGLKLWEITSVAAVGTLTISNKEDAYDLAFTAPTTGGAAGTISIRAIFIAG
jgi:hypothetical protein